MNGHRGAISRRSAIARMSAALAGSAWASDVAAVWGSATGLRKIATEEAFMIPEIAAAVREVVRRGGPNLDLKLLRLIYDPPADAAPPAQPRNFPITTSGLEDPFVLRFCVDKIGIDNVMWAIDYPYQPTAPAVAFLASAPLSDSERQRIAHRNAERIFGLPS